MIITTHPKRGCAMFVTAVLAVLAGASVAQAAAPVKLILTSHFGREVNLTETGLKGGQALEDVCVIASKDVCQQAVPSSEPGGFDYPEGIAGGLNGNIYIGDKENNRVQELTATGRFVMMFGKGVNATTGADVCSEEEIETSAVKCKAGIGGSATGQFSEIRDLAVDAVNGDVYVAENGKADDGSGARIQKFTADGDFVLEIGKEVNETTKANLCTEQEMIEAGVKCAGGAIGSGGGTSEHGAFTNLTALTVGGTGERLLYVGDGQSVQEFNEQGEWRGEVRLTSISSNPEPAVLSVAVDASGGIYLVDGAEGSSSAPPDAVRQFDPAGVEVGSFTVPPRVAGQRVNIHGLAIDPLGHLAVWVYEGEGFGDEREFGDLYEAGSQRLLTQFSTPEAVSTNTEHNFLSGIGFNDNGELFAVFGERSEVWSYAPVQVGELMTKGATCGVEASPQTSSTVDCQLSGEANPYGVANTNAWFEWGEGAPGKCVPGSETAEQAVATSESPVQVRAEIEGLRPNEQFCYRLAGSDQRSERPEKLTGEVVSARTPVAAPKITGQASASFVTSFGVVISGELNPENAPTEYLAEYAAGGQTLEQLCPGGLGRESCSGVSRTTALEAAAYGQIGATLESRGLQPDTQYHYRLVAKNAAAEVLGAEGAPFQTAALPQVQAETGAADSIATTAATVSGAVNPDGQPATYAFELGIYAGPATQYSVVFSGAAGAGAAASVESLVLTGLQPGTTYAYRIEVASGYGVARGQTLLFTTAGLPAVLAVPASLPMLAVPDVPFPRAPHLSGSHSSKPRSRGTGKALRACRKAKQRRAACKRQVRKRHVKVKSVNYREKQR